MRWLLVLALALASHGCAERKPVIEAQVAGEPTESDDPDRALAGLINDVAVLATGATPTERRVDELAAALRSDATTWPAVIDEFLQSESFATEVALDVVFPIFKGLQPFHLLVSPVLQTFEVNRPGVALSTIYYLYEPCKPEEAVKVRPWWDSKTEVLVCPDSYRPDVFGDDNGQYCSGRNLLEFSKSCGCGPSLMRCVRSWGELGTFTQSWKAEVNNIVRDVTGKDRPLSEIFTTNATARDMRTEFFYQRARIEARAQDEFIGLEDWSDAEQKPRLQLTPGQQAGILTTPAFMGLTCDRRSLMRIISNVMWCVKPDSSGVSTADVLELAGRDLRGDLESWQKLAHRPICTRCHARLDYGARFIAGIPYVYRARHFIPAQATPDLEGEMYFADADDPRGKAPLTTLDFARLAATQPEFSACMAQRVQRHVFGYHLSNTTFERIATAAREHGTLRAIMKVALQEYVDSAMSAGLAPQRAERVANTAGGRTAERPTSPGEESPANAIVLGDETVSLLNASCVLGCHTEGAEEQIFRDLPRAQRAHALKMLDAVSADAMPKDEALERTTRRSLIRALVNDLWSGESERATALAFYTGLQRAPLVYTVPSVFKSMHRHVTGQQATDVATPAVFETLLSPHVRQLSPGLTTAIGVEAVRACRRVGGDDAAFTDCLLRATEPRDFLNLSAAGSRPAPRPAAEQR